MERPIKGRPSYAEVWASDQSWIRWFLTHYQTSVNLEHMKVIKYIKLKIEERENQEGSQQSGQPKAKAALKSLATAVRGRPVPHPGQHRGVCGQSGYRSHRDAPDPDAYGQSFQQIPANKWEDPWSA